MEQKQTTQTSSHGKVFYIFITVVAGANVFISMVKGNFSFIITKIGTLHQGEKL